MSTLLTLGTIIVLSGQLQNEFFRNTIPITFNSTNTSGIVRVNVTMRGHEHDYEMEFYYQNGYFEISVQQPENFYHFHNAGKLNEIYQLGHINSIIDRLNLDFHQSENDISDLQGSPYGFPPQNPIVLLPTPVYRQSVVYCELKRYHADPQILLAKTYYVLSKGLAIVKVYHDTIFISSKGYIVLIDPTNFKILHGVETTTISREIMRNSFSSYVIMLRNMYNVWV